MSLCLKPEQICQWNVFLLWIEWMFPTPLSDVCFVLITNSLYFDHYLRNKTYLVICISSKYLDLGLFTHLHWKKEQHFFCSLKVSYFQKGCIFKLWNDFNITHRALENTLMNSLQCIPHVFFTWSSFDLRETCRNPALTQSLHLRMILIMQNSRKMYLTLLLLINSPLFIYALMS